MRTIAFYSFKGGVGRTALCVNLGVWLAKYRNARVLLVDWDLRAPGMVAYRDLKPARPRLGVADFLVEAAPQWEEVAHTYKPGQEDDRWEVVRMKLASLPAPCQPSELISALPHLTKKVRARTSQRLAEATVRPCGLVRVIHAGTPDALRCYDERPLKDPVWRAALARYFREDIACTDETARSSAFDFMLVDAQAGESPTSLLPREQLFDSHIFLVGALNHQNREGFLRILEGMTEKNPSAPVDDPFGGRFIPFDHLPAFVSVVLSPVPDSSDATPDRRIHQFQEEVASRVLKTRTHGPEAEAPPQVFTLPYTRALALGERILPLDAEDSSYVRHLEEIAEKEVLEPGPSQ